MPATPTSNTVLAVSQPLTNVSIAYTQQGAWVADRVFPAVPVARQGDIYWKYNRGDWLRGMAEKRAPATESSGGGYRLETDNYYAHVYAVHRDVDDQTRANFANQFNLDAEAARWVTQQLMLKRDRLWLDTYFKTGVWTGGVSANQNVDWTIANASTNDPVMDVRNASDAIEGATGYRPNTLVLGRKLLTILGQHPDLIDRIKYSGSAIAGVTTQAIANALDVDRIVVSNTVQNTGEYLGTESTAFAAGDGALLVYAAPNPGLMQPSAGYTFSWTGYAGQSALAPTITRFRDQKIRADRVEGELAFDFKVVAPDLGAWFATPAA